MVGMSLSGFPWEEGAFVGGTIACQSPEAQSGAGRSLHLALAAARAAADNRGQDVIVLDVRERTSLFDYFVIATGV